MHDEDEEREEVRINLYKCFEDNFFILKNLKFGLSKYNNEIEVKKIYINTIIFEGHEIKF